MLPHQELHVMLCLVCLSSLRRGVALSSSIRFYATVGLAILLVVGAAGGAPAMIVAIVGADTIRVKVRAAGRRFRKMPRLPHLYRPAGTVHHRSSEEERSRKIEHATRARM